MIPIPGFPVKPMSGEDIEEKANLILQRYQPDVLDEAKAIDIEWLMDSGIFKDYGFCWQLVAEEDQSPAIEASTHFQLRTVFIRDSLYQKLGADNPRARFTIAHEAGHIVLHTDQWDMMIRLAARAINVSKLVAYRSPEWQASRFGAALLMPTVPFWTLYEELKADDWYFPGSEIQELASVFKVSLSAVSKRIRDLSKINKKGSPMV